MTPGDPYEGDLLGLALHSCSFFECYDCKKPYFGGMVDCQQQLGMEENTKKENLRCKDCQLKAYGAGVGHCEKHGTAHIDWKCSYCCSVAMWHCFGTTYMCDKCHSTDPYGGKLHDCGGKNCPLGMPHPPADKDPKKSTFPLGCGLCRSDRLAELRQNNSLVQEVTIQPIEFEWRKQREEAEKKRKAEEEAERRRVEAERRRAEEARLAEERRQAELRRIEEEKRR